MSRSLLLSAAVGLLAGCGPSASPVRCAPPPADGTPRGDLPPPSVSPCDANGWCWENPLPFRDALGPLHHTEDVTVVTSERGHVLRLVDGVWEALPPLPRPPGLTGNVEPTTVFALGELVYLGATVGIEGAFYRFDGERWEVFLPPSRFLPGDIAVTGRDELVVVGSGGALRFDGRALVELETPRAVGQGVYGCHGDYVGAFFQGSFVDEELVLARGNRGFSKFVELPAVAVLISAVSGASGDDVFFAGFPIGGSRSTMWHWDGSALVDAAIADAYAVSDVVALGGGDAIATGSKVGGTVATWRREGGVWSEIAAESVGDLSAASADDMLGRSNLALFQFDGVRYRSPFPLPLPSAPGADSLVGVYGTSSFEPLVVGTGAVYRRSAAGYVPVPTPALANRALRGAFGRAQEAFVFGDDGWLLRFDGASFVEHAIPASEFAGDITSGFALEGGAVFVGTSSGKLYSFDGSAFVEVARLLGAVVGVYAASASDVWALADSGRLAHFDGSLWDTSQSLPSGPGSYATLAGAGANAVFATVGARVHRFDGTSWSAVDLATPGAVTAIHPASPTDVLFVGTSATAFRFDGTRFVDVSADLAWSFRAVSGSPAGPIAVGDLGTIAVRRGATP